MVIRQELDFRTFPRLHGLEAVFARNARIPVSRHAHSRPCAVFVEEGVRHMTLDARRHALQAGQGLLVGPGRVHTCEASHRSACSYTMYCLGREVLDFMAGGLGLDRFPVGSGPLPARAFAPAMRLKNCLLSGDDVMQAQEWLLDFAEVLARTESEEEPEGAPERSAPVRRALDCIHAHYAEPLRLEDLCEANGCAPQSLCRAFTRQMGRPPHTYLNQVRVNAARIVLAEGGEPVQAALDAGFADQSHFCRVFKRLMGMTPGRYVRGIREGGGGRQ